MNHTCKHDFIKLEQLSRSHNHILIVMIFRYFVLKFIFLLFYCDVIMMNYVIRGKPFDVMTINRIANMTSVDCATRLVNECQVKRRKG